MLAIALFVLLFAAAAALSGGRRAAALGGVLGVLLDAMNYHTPLLDWLYPPDEKEQTD
jgi:hypothetical protein